MKQKKPAKANPMAKDLRTPKYRPRIVESKKLYKRKSRGFNSAQGDLRSVEGQREEKSMKLKIGKEKPARSYFVADDPKEHAKGNAGENVPDYCRNCREPFMNHKNGRCPESES